MNLKDYLKKKGLKQYFVAAQLGITPAHFHRILNGIGCPSLEIAVKIELLTNGEVTPKELYLEAVAKKELERKKVDLDGQSDSEKFLLP